MTEPVAASQVETVRRFNRFYTRQIGVLDEGLLGSPFSLTEVRILYELAHRSQPTAAELGKDLGLDPGYLSRTLRRFHKDGLIDRRRCRNDARQVLIALTDHGREAFAPLDAKASEQVAGMLAAVAPADRARLVAAAETIERVLAGRPAEPVPYLIRPPRPGDLGWVVQRHGALYDEEYGWGVRFEALVAGIVAEFARGHDPNRERGWIAERTGEPVGSVFLVRESDAVAKLRLLLVEPAARGLGIGRRLVEECIRFARQAGYSTVTLWTNDVLHAARRIYQAAGFRLVNEEPHGHFGHGLVGQTWELTLRSAIGAEIENNSPQPAK